jgi:hypothetical protein
LPKHLGGLGIKDLGKFGRALRLKWLWHGWDTVQKPWKQLLKVSDQAERQLFFASTLVRIGNGRSTPFWEARWIHGAAPKDLAPSLYRLARFKYRIVFTELSNSNWISSLVDITTTTEMEDFTLLFMAISSVFLTDQPDTITWRWTRDGKFIVASAYRCQFQGTYIILPATKIWKCFAEPKVRFFLWLVLNHRLLTVDNMLKKLALQSDLFPLLLHGGDHNSPLNQM